MVVVAVAGAAGVVGAVGARPRRRRGGRHRSWSWRHRPTSCGSSFRPWPRYDHRWWRGVHVMSRRSVRDPRLRSYRVEPSDRSTSVMWPRRHEMCRCPSRSRRPLQPRRPRLPRSEPTTSSGLTATLFSLRRCPHHVPVVVVGTHTPPRATLLRSGYRHGVTPTEAIDEYLLNALLRRATVTVRVVGCGTEGPQGSFRPNHAALMSPSRKEHAQWL